MGVARAGHYWPTTVQTDLLRACLLPGEAAVESWMRWRETAGRDRLDTGSERLLPLLAHNLRRQGVADPRLGRYAGIVEYTWVTNQRRLAAAMSVVRAFHRAGIPAMFLKGMALAEHHYDHAGLRPMDDVDLLVPLAHAREAMGLLGGLGWQAGGADPDLTMVHSRPFRRANEGIDLHWHALWEASGATSDDELWSRSSDTTVHETPMRVLAADDLLLQVIVHGARWHPIPPLRWIADAATIITRAGPAFDWARLSRLAATHRLVLPVRDALGFLAETFHLPVPRTISVALDGYAPSRFERLEHRARARSSPRVGCFPLVLCHHARVSGPDGLLALVWRLPRYLRAAYALPGTLVLPAYLGRRVVHRLLARRARRIHVTDRRQRA